MVVALLAVGGCTSDISTATENPVAETGVGASGVPVVPGTALPVVVEPGADLSATQASGAELSAAQASGARLLGTSVIVASPPGLTDAGRDVAPSGDAAAGRGSADPDRVLDDLSTYWARSFDVDFGTPFLELAAGWAGADGGASGGGVLCMADSADVLGNAYYCPGTDGIVYDTGLLLPVLEHGYGDGAVTASLAHEFGHAISARIGPTVQDRAEDPVSFSTLYVELQADCYAGVFLAAAADGTTGATRIERQGLPDAIGPLLDFRDGIAVRRDQLQAHGLGLDRLQAVLTGWSGTGATCKSLDLDDLRLTLATPGTDTDRAAPARFDSPTDVREAAVSTLRLLDPGTADAADTDPVPVPGATEIGQFALATGQVLDLYQQQVGLGPDAVCRTGAWVGAVFGSTEPGTLGSGAGDADEALDLIRVLNPSTDELIAFVDGFTDGVASC